MPPIKGSGKEASLRPASRAGGQPLSLKARAVALLAQREHSAMELRRKLLRIARERRDTEGMDPPDSDPERDVDLDHHSGLDEEIESVLAWLKANGYLDESRFVESRLHARAQRFGQRRIEQELAQHGLSMDAEQRAALAAGELDRACDVLRRKFGEGPPPDAAAEARRLRFLVGRGFSAELARKALRRVVSEPGLDA